MDRKQEFGHRAVALRCWALWISLAALALVAALYFDASALRWVARHQTPEVRTAMRAVSRWGDWPQHVLLGGLAAAASYRLGSRRWTVICLTMIAACTLSGSLNRVVKIAAGRARPTVANDAGWHGPRWQSKYHAFPSGHTSASTAFFAVLFFARPRVGAALLAVPLAIAWSRLYLGAHHLSDVVFGATLGIWAGWWAWRFAERRFIAPVPG